jgi:hypothetical protein
LRGGLDVKSGILNDMVHSIAGLLLLKPNAEEAKILSEICQGVNELKRRQTKRSKPVLLDAYRRKASV